nr:MAG TPA: hypothetical protein [Caudoviricetes sp.]
MSHLINTPDYSHNFILSPSLFLKTNFKIFF